MNTERKGPLIVLATVLLLIATAALLAERFLPRGGAVAAVRFHLDALRQADLADLEESATEAVVRSYQTQASEPAYREISSLYNDRIPRLARPKWTTIRNEARAAAGEEYEGLREKVVPLGRVRYQQLTPEERRSIIESGSFNQYVFEAGVDLLPVDERDRVPDPRAFYRREDKRSYQAEQAWRHVPDEFRGQLGSREALLDADTPEKLAYFDQMAMPMLSPEDRQTVATVPRADVESLGSFVAGHGERLLTERLRGSPPPLPIGPSMGCSSVAFDRGALLHGPLARCQSAGGKITFLLAREPFAWRVIDVDGLSLGDAGR